MCNFTSSFVFLLKSEYNVLFIIIKSLVGRMTFNGKEERETAIGKFRASNFECQVSHL